MSAAATLAAFETERPRLFGLAYRMLGSVGDAEDLVQDAYVRWRTQDTNAVRSPQAFLTATVTRLCIDRLRHRRVERERYPGEWLPEPLVAQAAQESPEERHARDETLSLALLRMLERCTPQERAVFVLREAFDLEYAEIAEAIGAPAATCRQWFHRARAHLAGERRFELRPQAQVDVVRRLQHAIAAGDVDGVVALLDPRVEMRGDGGGKVSAFVGVVTGVRRVATVLVHLARTKPRRARAIAVNGGIGIALFDGDRLDTITMIEIADERVLYIESIRNPDKLVAAAQRLAGADDAREGAH